MAEPVLPAITDVTRPFWDGAAAGELRFQRCGSCGHLRYPIAPVCPRCLAERATWETMSGDGTILTFVIFHRAYHPSRAETIPYAVALVQTTEGPRMFSDLPAGDEERVTVGADVKVWFDRTDGVVVPRFRLAAT